MEEKKIEKVFKKLFGKQNEKPNHGLSQRPFSRALDRTLGRTLCRNGLGSTKCPTKFDGDCASAKKFPRKFDVIELCTKSRAERQRRGI